MLFWVHFRNTQKEVSVTVYEILSNPRKLYMILTHLGFVFTKLQYASFIEVSTLLLSPTCMLLRRKNAH